jgi:hypothetical protein
VSADLAAQALGERRERQLELGVVKGQQVATVLAEQMVVARRMGKMNMRLILADRSAVCRAWVRSRDRDCSMVVAMIAVRMM